MWVTVEVRVWLPRRSRATRVSGGGGAFFSQILWPLWEGKAQDPVRNVKGRGLVPGTAGSTATRDTGPGDTQGAESRVLARECGEASVPSPRPRTDASHRAAAGRVCQARKAHVPCPPPTPRSPERPFLSP